MNRFNPTDVFIILGRRGSGKSYLGKRIQSAYPRKIIIDPMGEYDEASCPGVVFIVEDFDKFAEVLLQTAKGKYAQFTIVFRFGPETKDNRQTIEEILRVCWYRGGILVVIEEIQMFASTHEMPHWLYQLLFTGRHQQVGLMFTTQRPGACHKSIISQANHIFCGSIHERNDLMYVSAVLGKEYADKLPLLPERKFVYFQPGFPKPVLVNNDLS